MRRLNVIFIIIFGLGLFSPGEAQLRMNNEQGTNRTRVKKIHKPKTFLFQIEPAISFPKVTMDGDSFHYYDDYYNSDASVAGGNLSFLIMPGGISNIPISSDSTIKLENRIRITTGFWHLAGYDIIPLRAGFDLGIKKKLGKGLDIIPHMGFQYGICFDLNGGDDVVNRMYNFRFGLDLTPGTSMVRVGVAYTINRVMIKAGYGDQSGKLKYNQLALNVSI